MRDPFTPSPDTRWDGARAGVAAAFGLLPHAAALFSLVLLGGLLLPQAGNRG